MTRVLKRLIIGSPVRSEHAGHSLLPKRLALPIFASDALSSVANVMVTSVPWQMTSSSALAEAERRDEDVDRPTTDEARVGSA